MSLLGALGSFFGIGGFGGGSGTPTAKPKPTERVGSAGFAVFGGFIQSIETNSDLIGVKRYATYRNAILNIPIAAKGIRLYLDLGAGAAWAVEPANDSRKAKQIAERTEKAMNEGARPWRQIVRYQLNNRFFDFAAQAWQAARRDDGTWGLEVDPRPNHTVWRWDVDLATGQLRGFAQIDPQTMQEVYVPRARLIYSVDATFIDDPQGMGLVRHLVETSERIKEFRRLEAIGFQNELAGTPIARIPYAALDAQVGKTIAGQIFTQGDRDALVNGIEAFIQKHMTSPARGLALDSATYVDNAGNPSTIRQWDIETLHNETSDAQKNIGAAIEREEHRAAIVVDAEHLLLSGTSNAGGNKAVSKDKSERVSENVNGGLQEVADVLNRDYIGALGMLNGWPRELWPKLKPADVTPLDAEAMSRILMNEGAAMLMPGDEARDYVRGIAGIPAGPSPEEMAADAALRAEQAAAAQPKPAPKPGGGEPTGGAPGQREAEAA